MTNRNQQIQMLQSGQIAIYNAWGQPVFSQDCEQGQTIPVSGWASGIYIVTSNKQRQKIVIF